MGQWNICTSAFSHTFVGNKLMIKGCMINIHNINSGVIAFGLQIYLKKGTMAQVFSCEFCEISKNTFFTDYSRTTASERRVLPQECNKATKEVL